MTKEELMIGDWVQSEQLVAPARYSGFFRHFPKPVSGKPYTRLECLYEGGREGGEVPEDKVMPIPLTPEILEKNGINLDMNVDLTKPLFSMGIHANDTCVKKRFRYIHELQHALRLCGLEELADNFKIK